MLHAPVQPPSYSLRERKTRVGTSDGIDPSMADMFDEDDGGGGGAKERSKSRRELPAGAVATLKAWLLSPEHFTHPYPTPQDQVMLMQKTGIDKKQLKNWFTNARRRIWKPMLKKQIEQGQLAAPPAGVVPGAVPGLMMAGAAPAAPVMDSAHSMQAMRVHYQQAVDQTQQQQAQQATTEQYGNQSYQPVSASDVVEGQGAVSDAQTIALQASTSIGTLPQFASSTQLSKTDSHAVLMELFARDQDLVKQATESARLKAEASKQQQQQQPSGLLSHPGAPSSSSQHPMQAPSQPGLSSVPTLNSWPHFSSINSLSNLGSLPGVKSISSLSGIDLASKGNLNKMGNLAQVKSVDSMGKNDSYAFLEVFFGGDRNSTNNLSAMMGGQKSGGKQTGEEDNEIGLSLEDEGPTSSQPVKREYQAPAPVSSAPQPAPITASGCAELESGGTLKRAYDDALAARGLLSVSRSSEKLTDLILPEKMQRTLSQEFISRDKTVVTKSAPYCSQFAYPPSSTGAGDAQPQFTVPPKEATHPPAIQSSSSTAIAAAPVAVAGTDAETDGHVQVSPTTMCALCAQVNVDTQLRPCGHMFHERCLKPSLQTPSGPPKCPIDHIPMASALLAVPTEEVAAATATPTVSAAAPPQQTASPEEAQENNPSRTEPQNSWTFSSSRALSTEKQDAS